MPAGRKQYYLGAAISYGAIIFNIVAGLIYTPWMVAQIGRSDYALYTLATSFISIFVMDFGLSSAVSRYVAKCRAEGDEGSIERYVGIAYTLYLIIDAMLCIVLIVVYLNVDVIYRGLSSSELDTFRVIYVVVACYSALSFPFISLNGILSASERFIQLNLCDLLQKVGTIVLVVIALINGFGVVAVVSANAVTSLGTIAIKYAIVRKGLKVRLVPRRGDRGSLLSIFSISGWTTVASLAQRCIFNLAPTILGIVASSSAIAVFAPANTLEGYFYMVAAAVNGMFIARVSRYLARGERDKVFELMLSIGKYQMVAMGSIIVVFVAVGQVFVGLWMGEQYVEAAACATMLFCAELLLVTQQVADVAMLASDNVRLKAYGYIGMALICVVLSSRLSADHGAVGASAAIAVSYVLLALYLGVVYRRVLGFDMKTFYFDCYVRFVPSLLLAVVAGWMLRPLCDAMHISGWSFVFIDGGITFLVYLLSVLVFSLRRKDRKMIRKVVAGLSCRAFR